MPLDNWLHIVYSVTIMVRAQILFTPTLYDQLCFEAQTMQVSISELVRQAVAKLLKKNKKTGGEVLREMASHAVSAPRAPRDLGSNDEYLYGINSPDNR